MQSLDQQVIACALKWHRQGDDIWLCTVLHSWGSAPRARGESARGILRIAVRRLH